MAFKERIIFGIFNIYYVLLKNTLLMCEGGCACMCVVFVHVYRLIEILYVTIWMPQSDIINHHHCHRCRRPRHDHRLYIFTPLQYRIVSACTRPAFKCIKWLPPELRFFGELWGICIRPRFQWISGGKRHSPWLWPFIMIILVTVREEMLGACLMWGNHHQQLHWVWTLVCIVSLSELPAVQDCNFPGRYVKVLRKLSRQLQHQFRED